MPREQDPIWKHVQRGENGKWKCKFCSTEANGSATRIRAHLAGILGYGIKVCKEVKDAVRAEALEGTVVKGKGSGLDKRTGGTSGKGTEGTVFGASRSVLPSEGASNPNDTQNSNRHGCAPQQQSFDRPTGTGTAPACPQDQVSLPPRGIPLDNLDNTQQSHPSNRRLDAAHGNENVSSLQPLSSLYISEPPALPELSTHLEFGTGTARACPQDELSLPPGDDMPLGNLDNTQQSDLLNHRLDASHENEIASSLQQPSMDWSAYLSELLAPPELPTHLEFGGDVLPTPLLSNMTATGISQYSSEQYPSFDEQFADEIILDSPLHSTENPHCSLLENPLESRDVIVNTSEEIQKNELYNPTVGSSLKNDSSLNVDSANRLQDYGQVGVVPVRNNKSLTNTVRHPGQLPQRCDKEDGNDTRRFPLQTPMGVDPLIASQHTSVVDSLVPEAATNAIGPSSSHELDMNEGAPMTSHPNTGNNFEENRALKRKLKLLYSKGAIIRDELEYGASLSLKKMRMEVVNWLANVEKLINDCTEAASEDCLPPHQWVDTLMCEVEDHMRQDKGLFEARETKVSKLLENKMVGEAFQRNTTKILEYLEGNQISRLGVYGMGGVGKTTIMVHIYNRLLEKKDYVNVLWITVSQDFKTQEDFKTQWLQDAIGKELGLNIRQENDVRKRAAMLFNCLTKRGKSTIILDDVWECFDLEGVGIPVIADRIKLVLTTRSIEVCRKMKCQEMIKIEPLSQIEAKGLFLEELTSEVALNLEIKAIVKSIVKECAGLPLAVITMATSMRGVTDVLEWKDSLEKLRESDMGQTDMEKDVLMKLKFSYDRLGNDEVKRCFLYCALYPEDKLIDKFELIEFFIDQELIGIGRLYTREKQHVRGSTILNKLVNVCLLEDHGRKIKMHDLIRDMALHVMSEISIVEAQKGLRRISYEENWTGDLEKVSLMENEIKEFPLNVSPNCPKLSTFLFNKSSLCDVIPDCFFRGLKVLNLSGCNLRELPDSISDLVHLTALLIRKCLELCCIPCLGKLKFLRKLDAVCCVKLEEIKGLEMLVNLTYLDIAHTRIKRLPKGTLGATLKLQYLSVQAVSEEEIIKLQELETLKCEFEDVDDFNKLVRVVSKQENNPRYYKLNMCRQPPPIHVDFNELAHFEHCERSVHIGMRNIVSAGGESSGGSICILIPRDVRILMVSDCEDTINLCGMGPLENIEELRIIAWKNLGVLCRGQDEEIIDIHDSPALTPAPLLFRSLRDLTIAVCWQMKYLFRHGPNFSLPHLQKIAIITCGEMVGITVATSPPPHFPPAFPSLEEITVRNCRKMKRLVESEWLPHFPKLKIIEAVRLDIEEIIGVPPPYMPIAEISLEQLRVSSCRNMRRLFSHEWMLHLRNLQTIDVYFCSEMVEMISGVGQAQEGSMTTSVNNTPSSSSQSSIFLPELKQLELRCLPHLKSICEVPITCDSMEYLRVFDCPELNKIPLQLQLRDIGDLPYIEVASEEKWKTLIWDHPNAQAILQPHLLFHGSLCVLEGRGRSISSNFTWCL